MKAFGVEATVKLPTHTCAAGGEVGALIERLCIKLPYRNDPLSFAYCASRMSCTHSAAPLPR